MIKNLLIQIAIKEDFDPENSSHRTRLASVTGVLGIILNLVNTIAKVLIGLVAGSMVIVSDGINNLTDTFSSIVTTVGVIFAGSPSDEKHPHGHGRLEYLIALIISIFVFIVGLILLRSSIGSILNPSPIEFSWLAIAIVIMSMTIKYIMYKFYTDIGKEIDSSPMRAAALDSIGDVLISAVVLLAYIFSTFSSLPIDGIGSFIVSILILKNGFEMISDMVSELVGEDMEYEFKEDLVSYFDREGILETHDLYIHNYGPSVVYATIDAVVDPSLSLRQTHRLFTQIEYEIERDLGVIISIHLELQDDQNPEEKNLRCILDKYIKDEDKILSYHDEQIVELEDDKCLGVHLLVDYTKVEDEDDKDTIKKQVEDQLRLDYPGYDIRVVVDKAYENHC